MQRVVLFSHLNAVVQHWYDALNTTYLTTRITDESSLLKHLKKHEEDIIMLDETSINDIFSLIESIKKISHAKIAVFHALPEVYHASNILRLRIAGYENCFLAKNNLHTMLETITHGKSWVFEELTYFIINEYVNKGAKKEPEFMEKLTQKEREIALMIADGLSNKEIASREKNALSTIKTHIHKIFEKAGVKDRVSLAMKFK